MKKKLVVANWKMNPLTAREAHTLFSGTKKAAGTKKNIQTVVCPPFIYLETLSKALSGHRCALGAQDGFPGRVGSHTGEVSCAQLARMKVQYVIVGHSERRAQGETDAQINEKVKAALKEKLTVILCVGERERDHDAAYLSFLREQVKSALRDVPQSHIKNLMIAYEPIWAIGAKEADTPDDALETILYIKKVAAEHYPARAASWVPVLYGGSVDKHNAADFLRQEGIDGLLVGRASLSVPHITALLGSVDRV